VAHQLPRQGQNSLLVGTKANLLLIVGATLAIAQKVVIANKAK